MSVINVNTLQERNFIGLTQIEEFTDIDIMAEVESIIEASQIEMYAFAKDFSCSILESAVNENAISNAISTLWTKFTKIISDCLEAINRIITNFKLAISKRKQDSYFKKEIKKMTADAVNKAEVTMDLFEFTNINNDRIPKIYEILEPSKAAKLVDDISGRTSPQEVVSILRKYTDYTEEFGNEDGQATLRGEILDNRNTKFGEKEYHEALFKIFRKGKDEADPNVNITYAIFTECTKGLNTDEAIKEVEKAKSIVEQAYNSRLKYTEKIKNSLTSLLKDQEFIKQCEESGKEYMSRGIEQNIGNFLAAECAIIHKISSYHLQAFAAKLVAIKDYTNQNVNVVNTVIRTVNTAAKANK